MKKVICGLIVLALVMCMVPVAFAVGSAAWGGPTVVRAGDTITLTFFAGGNIYGGSGTVSYDASVLTLQGYTQNIGGDWVVEFNGNNFVFYDNSMADPIGSGLAIFSATFDVSADVAPDTTISVSASGATLSDGVQDLGVGSPTYSATIAAPLSGNCNLSSMTVSGATISPAFSPDVTSYSASVPYETSQLSISATAEHGGAQVSVNNPYLAAAATTTLSVMVTAENGSVKTYNIHVTRAQDPNYVPSDNANLSELAVEGYALSPAFSADVTQYYVWLPYETDTVSLGAKAEDGRASVSIGKYEELVPGQGTVVPVTVTAENDSQKVYNVTVVRAPAHEDVEAYLGGEREQPVVEETQPPTEPETEPTTEPTTVPTTQPPMETTPPVVEEQPTGGFPLIALILVGIACMAVGAAITAMVISGVGKKKKPGKFEGT